MSFDLHGRSVVVTGGNGGIGLGMATALADAGASIVIWGRDEEKNRSACATLRERGATAHAVHCDVSSEEEVDRAFAESLELVGGRIDSLFANAGRGGGLASFVDADLDQWRAVMATNLDGAFLTLRAAARHMVASGHGGSLVAVSSVSAIHGAPRNHAYAASKTALLGLVRALAVELARHQIRVNAILPGWTITDMAAGGYASDVFREATTKRTPVRRWAEPSEMGPVAVFLADPTVTFHTGDSVVVDGGYSIF